MHSTFTPKTFLSNVQHSIKILANPQKSPDCCTVNEVFCPSNMGWGGYVEIIEDCVALECRVFNKSVPPIRQNLTRRLFYNGHLWVGTVGYGPRLIFLVKGSLGAI